MKSKDRSGRNGRYFIASTVILVGLACAALMTDSIGNTLATGLIAVGLAMFIAFLFKDLGLNEAGRSSPGVPELPPLPEPEPPPAPAEAVVSPEQARAAAEGVHSAADAARRAAGFGSGGNGNGNGNGHDKDAAPAKGGND